MVTVWNLEDCINKALDSIEKQSAQPFEVLIIDDGSIDLSRDLIKKYIQRNKNWHLYSFEHNGVSHARNFALNTVKGDYILFLDGDDFYELNLLERLEPCLDQSPDIVAFKSYEFDNYSGRSSKSNWTIKTKIDAGQLQSPVLCSFIGWPWDKLFRLSFLRKHNLTFPILLNSEDLVFVYSALFLSKKTLIIDEYLIKHRINRNTSLSNNLQKSEDAFYEAILMLENFLKKDFLLWKENEQCFQQWSIDLTFWATRNRGVSFDLLKQLYPKINWKLEINSPNFYPNLLFLMRVAEKTRCQGFLWLLSYNLYKIRKFGLKRARFLFLNFLSRKICNFVKVIT